MPKPNPANSHIPLNCTICAKKPHFSDLSHLLTHISSKAHLHIKHNLTIKSQTDPEASLQLQYYQHWYDAYAIAGLLNERMTAKENKNKNRKTKQVEKRDDYNNIHPELQNLAAGQAYRAPVPLMQQPMPRGVTELRPKPSGPAPSWADDSSYGAPTMRSHVPNFTTDNDDSGSIVEEQQQEEEEEEEDPFRVAPSMEAKGIKWPGMSMFDAATPEQKRQRNQKKDGKIQEELEYTSRIIQAVEVVYNFGFEEVKRRDIDSLGEDADEDSLEPRPSPAPAKRRGRGPAKPRNALKQVDTNAPRKTQPPRKSKGRMRSRLNSFPNEGPRADPLGSALSASRSASTSTTPSVQLEPNNGGNNDYFGENGPLRRTGVNNMMLDERNSTGTESLLEEQRFEEFHELERPAKIESESPSSYSHYHANDHGSGHIYGENPRDHAQDGLPAAQNNLGPHHLYGQNPREHAQNGLSAAPRLAQGFVYQHYHQEAYHHPNPLYATNMNACLPRLDDYPSYPFDGDYKPFIGGGGENPGAESFSANSNENAPFHN